MDGLKALLLKRRMPKRFKMLLETSSLALLCALHLLLTIDAFEVQQVAAVVHLVELQAHLHVVAGDGVLAAHPQVVGVHHLQGETCPQQGHSRQQEEHCFPDLFYISAKDLLGKNSFSKGQCLQNEANGFISSCL